MVSDFKNLQIINQFCWCFLGDNEHDRVEVSAKLINFKNGLCDINYESRLKQNCTHLCNFKSHKSK